MEALKTAPSMHTSIEDRSKRNKIETQDEIPRNSLSTDCHSRHLDALSYLLPNIRFSFCIPLVHLTSARGFRRKPKPILKQTETFSRVTVHLPVRTLAPEGRFKNLRLNPRHYGTISACACYARRLVSNLRKKTSKSHQPARRTTVAFL